MYCRKAICREKKFESELRIGKSYPFNFDRHFDELKMSVEVVLRCSFVAIVFIWSTEEVVGKATGLNGQKSCTSCNLSNGVCGHDGTCRCLEGWRGENCDQCTRAAGCRHGTCQEPGQCICNVGYGGRHCQLDMKYCERHQPCRNGATCVNDNSGSYICQCTPNYTGRNCNLRNVLIRPPTVSRESNRACLNGGTCAQKNCKKCSCLRGFTGDRCGVPVRMCVAHPCANGARCRDVFGGYRCECVSGYVGKHCEKDVNECSILGASACENGGRCINFKGSYMCKCVKGFEGARCSKRVTRIQEATVIPVRREEEHKRDNSAMNALMQIKTGPASRGRETITSEKSSTNIKFTQIVQQVKVSEFNPQVDLVRLDSKLQQGDDELDPGDQASISIVQIVTYALLGVAIVLFVIIALVVWWHHSSRKRSDQRACSPCSNAKNLFKTEEYDDNRSSMIIDEEQNVTVETSNMTTHDDLNLDIKSTTEATTREIFHVEQWPPVEYLYVSLPQNNDEICRNVDSHHVARLAPIKP